ncbi:phage head closure protein [Rhodobacter sp. TJ_12]|uniref:phage head closure protein n=1 Tax=Rhodobacter sp. TJ_12 TaxID=2029399 RepID=UPI001CC1BEC0|nr:phage head closure protein [Rhodobacter sp. TJ_12]
MARLNTRITIQRATSGDDGYGNVTTGWADMEVAPGVPMKLWADIRETPGKEVVAAGRLEASRTATICVRASSRSRTITAADRIIARGQVWNIRSICAVADGRELIEMLCEAGGAV